MIYVDAWEYELEMGITLVAYEGEGGAGRETEKEEGEEGGGVVEIGERGWETRTNRSRLSNDNVDLAKTYGK